MSDSQHSMSPIRTRVQTRSTGRRKPHKLYYTDPRLMMTRMASALLITLACLPAVRAECSHGLLGFRKCCCTCQGKICEDDHYTGKCNPDCDACKCFQTNWSTSANISGVWRCSKFPMHWAGKYSGKSARASFIGNCPKCHSKTRFHTMACCGKGEKKGNKCVDPDCGPPVKTRNAPKQVGVKGVWKCTNGFRNNVKCVKQSTRPFPYTDGETSLGICKIYFGGKYGCSKKIYWHSVECWKNGSKCDDKCRCDCKACRSLIKRYGYRRLADTFPDCSVCEGSGKTRSWFLRQPCENCFGIGKVRD